MDEFELIERFFAAPAIARDDVIIGIGDDGAVTQPDPGAELVVATDTIVEGTHFPAGTPAHALGHRCLAVNLSDLAAMGAQPAWCTLAISLPTGSADWVSEFAAGFMQLAAKHGIALIGGDTVRGPLSITVTVHGQIPAGTAIRRDGAGSDEGIYVTGQPGAAAAGLALLQEAAAPVDASHELIRRFYYPDPRVVEGVSLREFATAMIDVSDGLHVDLERLLRASGCGAMLDVEQIRPAAIAIEQFGAERALSYALAGGDDYELCFTVSAQREPALRRLAETWDCGIHCLGRTQADPHIEWHRNGTEYAVPETSFRHFPESVK
jgi:thiamine-monophosphate kinase